MTTGVVYTCMVFHNDVNIGSATIAIKANGESMICPRTIDLIHIDVTEQKWQNKCEDFCKFCMGDH